MVSAPIQLQHFLIIIPKKVRDRNWYDGILNECTSDLKYATPESGYGYFVTPRKKTVNRSSYSKPEVMVCGDDQDFDRNKPDAWLGNGIVIRYFETGLEIFSSLTGLPPVYQFEDSHYIIFSDTIQAISSLSFVNLHFNREAIVEMGLIGKPINYKTLFNEILLIPAGKRIEFSGNGVVKQSGEWQQDIREYTRQQEYMDEVIAAFESAIIRIDTSPSFLSLTAGLDSRAILSNLLKHNKAIPCVTITGRKETLDSMRARQLCEYYDIRHYPVVIGNEFEKELPRLSLLASLHTGGLSSIDQAVEIYFNEFTEKLFASRVSGNLGNQIGRSGTEGTGERAASMVAFNDEYIRLADVFDSRHWFYKVNHTDDLLSASFILQQENLFAQLGNYSIGHHYLNQQTPYADKNVINLKFSEPIHVDNVRTIRDIKIRDLKHRILGQSVGQSFQSRIVEQAGGKIMQVPINWGWRVKGFYTPESLFQGGKALVDMLLSQRIERIPGCAKLLDIVGIEGFSGFQKANYTDSQSMQEFIKDTFSSQRIRECNLFNPVFIQAILWPDKNYHIDQKETILALDIALSMATFSVQT